MSGTRIARLLTGALLGTALGLAELVFLAVAAPAALIPALRPAAARGLARLTALERARLSSWLGHEPARRDGGYAYLAARAALGVLGGYVCASTLFLTVLLLAGGAWDLIWGESEPVPLELPGVKIVTSGGALGVTAGLALLAALVLMVAAVAALDRRLAAHFLGPTGEELMRRRIAELTETRSGIVRAVDDERRRIERDLHDGVQQRGVALAMLLGRARHAIDLAARARRDTTGRDTTGRDTTGHEAAEAAGREAAGHDVTGHDAIAGLVAQAYTESRQLLDELRSVAWRIYPTALDELGLRAALAGVAERAGVPVTVHHGLAARPASEIETALYFVAREAITNAVKHAGAHDILVVLSEDERTVSVAISDNGRGGADPSGGGLSGLARRVLALDGTFTVDSPPGGPTRIAATLPKAPPCG
ncbi:signal transduction histidine kinase [Nonomuraea thailandensis]|uniref:histidine kinase n=1 Tax=Nonomuraea thailandensis TaxID=1188745 RepID=A0A9X2K3Y8_9ACTN|nr:ATP-binding protein [Nonomuraea thailandensis]MCP2358854.1 signal transduction histidine kinase [Nonomuraea thailandensis]